jgi:hypothetical protein
LVSLRRGTLPSSDDKSSPTFLVTLIDWQARVVAVHNRVRLWRRRYVAKLEVCPDHNVAPCERGAKAQVRPHSNEEFLKVKTITFLLIAALLLFGCGAVARPARGYNVVMIVVDDLNTDLGCFGKPVITPNIDDYCQPARIDHWAARRIE